MDKLLTIIEKNAQFSNAELAAVLNISEHEVAEKLAEYKKQGVLVGTKTIINWEKTDRNLVTALIELKVIPERNRGFDEIAKTVCAFDEVETVYLMSGAYDLAVFVTGKTFKDVALFVATRLAVIDAVQSTATHFILRKYKESFVSYMDKETDEREVTAL